MMLRLWEETGELQRTAVNEYLAMTLRSWLISSGAQADGVSDRLRRYSEAAQRALERRAPDW